MECVLTDLEEISSHTLSKETFFSFVFNLQATLTTNYHENKNKKSVKIIIIKKRGADFESATFCPTLQKSFCNLLAKLYNDFWVCFQSLSNVYNR